MQVYHNIISFSNKDKQHVTETVLKDVANKFIELRGLNNLYVITSHHDHDHIHLHCAMSGTQLNGRSSRISRQEFAKLKTDLDLYQQKNFPQLLNSLPRHDKAKHEKEIEVEKNIKRHERLDKTIFLNVLETTFSKSSSREDFFSTLQELGHIPYFRAGNFAGIKYDGDRKFRIHRLGFDEKKLQQLDIKAKEKNQLLELQQLRAGKGRTKEIHQEQLPLQKTNPETSNNRLNELTELRNSANKKEIVSERTIEIERQDDRYLEPNVNDNNSINDTDSEN